MTWLNDDPDALHVDRAQALRRRTLLVGALTLAFASAAALTLLTLLAMLWALVQGLLGSTSAPPFHVPQGLQASAWGMASPLAYALLAVGVWGVSTGRIRRRYALGALLLFVPVAMADFASSPPLREPLYFVPSQVERELLSGRWAEAEQMVLDSSAAPPLSPHVAYVRAQIALRAGDKLAIEQLMREHRPGIERYQNGASRDPSDLGALADAYGSMRPAVLHAFDRAAFGRAVGSPALEYERRHGLDTPVRRGLGIASRALAALALSAAALLLVRIWMRMVANHEAVAEHL